MWQDTPSKIAALGGLIGFGALAFALFMYLVRRSQVVKRDTPTEVDEHNIYND